MELTGEFHSIAFTADGKPLITFKVNEYHEAVKASQEFAEGVTVALKVGKPKGLRSLDANSYYWLLLNKLARKLNISTSYCHNLMLRRYGVLEEYDGQVMYVVILDTDEASKTADEAEKYHIKPTSNVREGNDGLMYRTYLMLKGSSKYTKKEFSHLVNGLVDECRQVGIQTATPDEIAMMISRLKEVGE
jgi:hypothetical protein